MNYYPFHLGDYAAHTAHLEPMEDLAYRRMLDLYYRSEKPLPLAIEDIARLIRMREFAPSIRDVLNEFFVRADDGWRHARCDAEIAKMLDKQAKAQASARASVNARSANAQRTLSERSTAVELPTPTPTPTPEKTMEQSAPADADAPTRADPIPYQSIVEAYNATMTKLPKVRELTPKRRTAIRRAWQESQSRQSAEFWRAYFEECADDPFRSGAGPYREPHANWRPDFDFLIRSDQVTKVYEAAMHRMGAVQ